MPGRRWCAALVAAALCAVPGTAWAQARPGIPSSVAVSAGDGSAVVTWVPPSDGGDPIRGYTVTADPGGATAAVAGGARTATVTGLANGTAYRFTVVAANGAGPGPASAVSDAVTPRATAAPAGRTLIDEHFDTDAPGFRAVAGGTWQVASGRYVLSAPADGGESVANANLAVDDVPVDGDFTLTVSAATTPTDSAFNDFSVVFDFQDPANYYFASFSEGNDANTSGLFRVSGGSRHQLADITVPVVAGAVYPVRVERRGAVLRVYRGQDLVATASDDTFPRGLVGFGSRNDGGTFDDLLVTTPVPAPPRPAPGPFTRFWAWLGSLFTSP